MWYGRRARFCSVLAWKSSYYKVLSKKSQFPMGANHILCHLFRKHLMSPLLRNGVLGFLGFACHVNLKWLSKQYKIIGTTFNLAPLSFEYLYTQEYTFFWWRLYNMIDMCKPETPLVAFSEDVLQCIWELFLEGLLFQLVPHDSLYCLYTLRSETLTWNI